VILEAELNNKLNGKRVALHYGSPYLAMLGKLTPGCDVEYPPPLGFSITEAMYQKLEDFSYLIFEQVFGDEEPKNYVVADARRPRYAASTIRRLVEKTGTCIIDRAGELLEMDESKIEEYLNRFCYRPLA